ncbi:MAG: SDR family NAD(P)-dependent oxidoreductase [Chloroflexota bacterium]
MSDEVNAQMELMPRIIQALDEATSQLEELKYKEREPIAILGVGCRFPGDSDTPEQFWQLLANGVDAVVNMPNHRRADSASAGQATDDRASAWYGGFLTQVDQFEPEFFGISPRETNLMDPQQRLLLEVSWEALESAGLVPESLLHSPTGVFVGICNSDYSWLLHSQKVHAPQDELYLTTGAAQSVAAGRLAYSFGFTGPAVAVDTACSSSLVALHQACQSLRQNECNLALAGGVNLILNEQWVTEGVHAEDRLHASDGRCKTFDAAANGFGRGEGCGMVVLKRLSDAKADGDPILAVIRGSMVNQDGRSSGLSAPSGPSQQSVIQKALNNAELNPEQISYIEAHGTGTTLGDPIEIGALNAVFGRRKTPLWIGSVKTNFAHLEGAAGIAGLIKVLLSIQHGQIPPHLHLKNPNPYIDWNESIIQVPLALTDWPAGERTAGISSFGISGTNAHIIVQEASSDESAGKRLDNEPERSYHLLTIAAKSEDALQEYVHLYQKFLTAHPELDIGNLCYSSHIGRSHFRHRLTVVADSLGEMQTQLASYSHSDTVINLNISHGLIRPRQATPKIAFLFTGQGSQYVEMGRELYETAPFFRATLDQCDEILEKIIGESLLSVLYPEKVVDSQSCQVASDNNLTSLQPATLLNQTQYTQPALFTLEFALAKLWQSWGIQPDVLIGHSVGEIVAACVAGVFSLEGGLKLVAARGRLISALPQDGTMVSLMADEERIRESIAPYADEVSMAAVNGPESIVISGKQSLVVEIAEQLAQEGIKTRQLTVSHAFHSPLMDPMLDEFRQIAQSISYHQTNLPLVSNVTGRLAGEEVTTPEYWVQHVREAVRFADGMKRINEQDVDILLEIGPKPTLLGMVGDQDLSYALALPSLREKQDDWHQMLTSLGELYIRGVEIDWDAFDKGYSRCKVTLPTYPFQRQRYWVDAPKPRQTGALRPLIDKMTQVPRYNETLFETEFSLETLPFLTDHRVYGTVISPGACQLAMVLSAAELTFGNEAPLCLEDITLPQALVIPEDQARTVQIIVMAPSSSVEPDNGPKYEFEQISFDAQPSVPSGTHSGLNLSSFPQHNGNLPEKESAIHATGYIAALSGRSPVTEVQEAIELEQLRLRCDQPVDVAEFYHIVEMAKIEFGPNFRWVENAWFREDGETEEVLGKLVLPDSLQSTTGHLIHPGLLDACFQVTGMIGPRDGIDDANGTTALPFAIKRMQLFQSMHGDTWWCYVCQCEPHKYDIHLLCEQGEPIAFIQGYEVRVATEEAIHGADLWKDWLYQIDWQPLPYFGIAPDYLPSPEMITPILQESISSLVTEREWKRYQTLMSELERLSKHYVVDFFIKAGFAFEPESDWSTDQIAKQVKVIPSYRRLLRRMLSILAEEDILQRNDDRWHVRQQPVAIEVSTELAAVQAAYGNAAELTLLARCGEKLSDVFRDVQDPLELLFQASNPTTDDSPTSELYSESIGGQLTNGLLQRAVQTMVAQLPANRGLRILEIGGSEGGTTACLLPLLPLKRTDYIFTDSSSVFLEQAQRRFQEVGFVRYQRLDIEQSPMAQGFAPHQVDLVIAANTLYATKDLAETLTHLRTLLQPGGQLILLEGTSKNRWADLTFGLTDGWWRFEDLRANQPLPYPLLAADQWKSLLMDNGFHAVEIVEQAGQAIIVAQVEDSPESNQEPGRTWLLFADAQDAGSALAKQLEQRGDRAILVYPGTAYQSINEQTIRLRPDCPEDYQKLLTDHPDPHGVIHLWSLDTLDTTKTTAKTSAKTSVGQTGLNLVEASKQSCGTVLHLTQALSHNDVSLAGLWLVTQNAQVIHQANELNDTSAGDNHISGVIQSTLWGMGRVIALEHPELNCVRIDLEATSNPATHSPSLYAEITSSAAYGQKEEQIVLHQDARYIARLARFELETAGTQPEDVLCQAEATYLITGGLGGIGLATAEWLLSQGAERLVLVGRRQPGAGSQAQIDRWVDQGIKVTVAQCDVADQAQLQQLIAEIDDPHQLQGIIHLAGVLEDGALYQQRWENFAKVFQPKVQGAWHLHELTQEMPLDFFILFSSSASLLGNQGQANYAAANAFLDALATYRHSQGLPALSINWGPWSDIGMAAELIRGYGTQMADRGYGVITPKQGFAALNDLLVQTVPQIGLIPIDWRQLNLVDLPNSAFFAALMPQSMDGEDADDQVAMQGGTQDTIRQQLESASPNEVVPLLQSYLQQMVARILYMAGLPSLESGFNNMGMDSLMSIELRRQLEKGLDLSLPSTIVFEYPTIELMGEYLLDGPLREIVEATDESQQGDEDHDTHREDHNEERKRAHKEAHKAHEGSEESGIDLETLSDAELNAFLEQELALLK